MFGLRRPFHTKTKDWNMSFGAHFLSKSNRRVAVDKKAKAILRGEKNCAVINAIREPQIHSSTLDHLKNYQSVLNVYQVTRVFFFV